MGARGRLVDYIARKFNLDLSAELPIRIPNTNRETLAELFHELGYKEGVEVGVWAGDYSRLICSKNPGVKLHCVDAWLRYPGYRDFVNPGSYAAAEAHTREILAPFGCDIIKAWSLDAVKQFPDRSLDFVYIDANHDIRHVIDDLSEWSNKVRHGGILAGHDYYTPGNPNRRCHVVLALNAYCAAWRVNPWFVLGRDTALPGELRDRERSWFIPL